jgi:hypothetical protein
MFLDITMIVLHLSDRTKVNLFELIYSLIVWLYTIVFHINDYQKYANSLFVSIILNSSAMSDTIYFQVNKNKNLVISFEKIFAKA